MPLKLLLFASGVVAVSFFSHLPPLWCLYLLLPVAISSWRWRICRYVLALCLGLAWGVYAGQQLVDMQLPEEWVGQDLLVTGQIQGLPKHDDHRQRFALRVHTATTQTGDKIALDKFPRKIQLSWYQRPAHQDEATTTDLPALKIGAMWQLRVRLKRPRGFANPAGFDYQAWLLRQGVGATGYVVERRHGPQANTQISPSEPSRFYFDDWIDDQRQQLQQWVLARSKSSERGILIALLIGDSALLEKHQRTRMQRTGTSHLIAISGLHVGFLAIFGFYIGLWLGKFVQLVWYRCPAQLIAWSSAIVCASFYSALAGFNIPTVRTLIMLAVFYLACFGRRSIRIVDIFCFALALVAVLDPLAALDIGFWLSFGAVALLLLYFSGRVTGKNATDSRTEFATKTLLGGVRSQWVMLIGLVVPLSMLVNTVSLVAPIGNAVAIPLITFFVVPLLLISAALRNVFSAVSDALLNAAGWGMELLKIFLEALLAVSGNWASPVVAFRLEVAVLVGLSCLILLLPKGLLPRVLGWGGLLTGIGLTFVLKPSAESALTLSVLDVGQGTAVVVQVGPQTLVYDTGPRYTASFDAGGAIVAPYLHALGIARIDTLVISHNDSDHAGGLSGLLEKIHVDQLLVGEPARINPQLTHQNCHQTPTWQWQEVGFSFLSVPRFAQTNANNHSCVLLISYRDQHILLPGDIETSVENHLLGNQQLPDRLSVLLAAHHGSRTSSSARFVNYVRPEIVIYSAGYHSQHGHPHPVVRQRFNAVGSREFNTAESGAVIFKWVEGELQAVQTYRHVHRRYWFD